MNLTDSIKKMVLALYEATFGPKEILREQEHKPFTGYIQTRYMTQSGRIVRMVTKADGTRVR